MARDKYRHRTEDRGRGIVAVFSEGPSSEVNAVDREGRSFAKRELTFEPGLTGRPVSGGGRFYDHGAMYEAQQIFVTKKLTPRED